MAGCPVVVYAGHNSVIKNRLKSLLLCEREVIFHEVKNRQELLRVLAVNRDQIDLLLADLEIENNNDFNTLSVIRLIKEKGSRIPVVVLSSESKINLVSLCLKAGAIEYILKPFKDDYLKEKLLKYVDTDSLNKSTILSFNLNDFLSSETYKAKKGNYCFTLLSIQFFSDTIEERNQSFLTYSDMIYRSIKELFWESDLYIQYGFQSHLGFFPFCSNKNIEVVTGKIQSCFENLKLTEPELNNYSFVQSYATCPSDGETVVELLQKLNNR